MAEPTVILVRLPASRPFVTTAPPTSAITAEAALAGYSLRLTPRGTGDVEARFDVTGVVDADVRGGYVYAIPGEPYIVRAGVDGWLSITVRRRR